MSAPFCKSCFQGTIRDDVEPQGTVTTIHGLPTYVAKPPSESESGAPPIGLVVMIPDGFGWEFRNGRALCDAYARRANVLVYLPDFMNGKAPNHSILPAVDNLMAPSPNWYTTLILKPWWVIRMIFTFLPFSIATRRSVVQPRLVSWFQRLRANTDEGTKIASAGFCWGGYYSVLLAQDRPETRVSSVVVGEDHQEQKQPGQTKKKLPLVDFAFVAHPGPLDVPADIQAVRRPLGVANGDNDEFMGREKMILLKKTLEEEKNEKGEEYVDRVERPVRHEVVVYEGAKHGFATRADPRDMAQHEMSARAEDQAVAWFKKNFAMRVVV